MSNSKSKIESCRPIVILSNWRKPHTNVGRIDLTKVLGLQTKWILAKDKVVETQRDIALAFAMANQALGNANRCSCDNASEPLNLDQLEEVQLQAMLVNDHEIDPEAPRPAFEE